MKKTFSKQLKLLFALGLAGASIFSACERDEPVIKQHDTTKTDTTPEIQYRDVYINYSCDDGSNDSLVTYDSFGEMHISPTLIRYDTMPDVRYIYIYVSPDDRSFMNCTALGIQTICRGALKPAMEYSKKTRAKGTFYFRAGEPSKVPEDSLWLVQHGWQIKNQYQR